MVHLRQSPSVRGNTAPFFARTTARRSVGVTARRSLGIACQRAEYSDAENSRPNSYHHHHCCPCSAFDGSQSRPSRTCAKPARKPGCVTMISQAVPRELTAVFAMPFLPDGSILPNRLFRFGRAHQKGKERPAWHKALTRIVRRAPIHLVQADQCLTHRLDSIRCTRAAFVAAHDKLIP